MSEGTTNAAPKESAIDFSHLDALQARLFRERGRLRDAEAALAAATGRRATAIQNEVDFRKREIAACEKEIAGEYKFLGIEPPPASIDEISDDDLLAELTS